MATNEPLSFTIDMPKYLGDILANIANVSPNTTALIQTTNKILFRLFEKYANEAIRQDNTLMKMLMFDLGFWDNCHTKEGRNMRQKWYEEIFGKSSEPNSKSDENKTE